MGTGACDENMVFHSLEYMDERVGNGDILGALEDIFLYSVIRQFFLPREHGNQSNFFQADVFYYILGIRTWQCGHGDRILRKGSWGLDREDWIMETDYFVTFYFQRNFVNRFNFLSWHGRVARD